jgi:hypothetical protein
MVVDPKTQESNPNTAKGNRALPLPDSLVRVPKRARKRPAADRLLLGVGYLEGGDVVADLGGSPMHRETVGLAWTRLLDRAGVRTLHLHDARLTCGTLMPVRGVPVAVIAACLGHRRRLHDANLRSHPRRCAPFCGRRAGRVTSVDIWPCERVPRPMPRHRSRAQVAPREGIEPSSLLLIQSQAGPASRPTGERPACAGLWQE